MTRSSAENAAPNVQKLLLKDGNYIRVASADAFWSKYGDPDVSDEVAIARLMDKGYDGIKISRPVRVKNDAGVYVLTDEVQDHVVVFKPENLRSYYADFTLAEQRRAAAIAQGFDVDRPVYRGAPNLGALDRGAYFASDPSYANKYSNALLLEIEEYSHLRPTSGKYFLPKDGVVDFRDPKIRREFEEWFADDYFKRIPNSPLTRKEVMSEAGWSFVANNTKEPAANGLPYYKNLEGEGKVKQFLAEKKEGWKVVPLYEGDAAKGVSNIT
jgi:hypothetical protein